MDPITQGLLYILLPAAILTVAIGLAVGSVANRLAKYRESLR